MAERYYSTFLTLISNYKKSSKDYFKQSKTMFDFLLFKIVIKNNLLISENNRHFMKYIYIL